MKKWLIQYMNYSDDNIIIMNEATSDKNLIPLKDNIIRELNNLVINTKHDDFRFIHYSGHGIYTKDNNNDEDDGKDEAICPLDYDSSGLITDDYLRENLIDKMPEGSYLYGIFDACHSGTIFDLKYKCITSINPDSCSYNLMQLKHYTNTKANVILLSGCLDNQTSVDSVEEGQNQGMLTYSFLKSYKLILNKHEKNNITHKKMIKYISTILKDNNYKQIAQLSSGKFIDLNLPLIV
jgi:hypothetical protein